MIIKINIQTFIDVFYDDLFVYLLKTNKMKKV